MDDVFREMASSGVEMMRSSIDTSAHMWLFVTFGIGSSCFAAVASGLGCQWSVSGVAMTTMAARFHGNQRDRELVFRGRGPFDQPTP